MTTVRPSHDSDAAGLQFMSAVCCGKNGRYACRSVFRAPCSLVGHWVCVRGARSAATCGCSSALGAWHPHVAGTAAECGVAVPPARHTHRWGAPCPCHWWTERGGNHVCHRCVRRHRPRARRRSRTPRGVARALLGAEARGERRARKGPPPRLLAGAGRRVVAAARPPAASAAAGQAGGGRSAVRSAFGHRRVAPGSVVAAGCASSGARVPVGHAGCRAARPHCCGAFHWYSCVIGSSARRDAARGGRSCVARRETPGPRARAGKRHACREAPRESFPFSTSTA